MGRPRNVNQATFEEARLSTKEQLDEQPKRIVRVAKDDSTKQTFIWVGVNGYNYQIVRGVEVEVPQTIYDLLVQGGYI